MKKLFYIFILLFPVIAFAQQNWYKYSPVNYMWKNVGNAGFSEGMTEGTILAFSPVDNQPYVAYLVNSSDSSKVIVSKFDGTNWVNMGIAGYSVGIAGFMSFALSPTDGQPYVAFPVGWDIDTVRVMKFDGANWVNVGNARFSAVQAWYTSLAFNSSGELYLVYGISPIVMKFDGIQWVRVGTDYLTTQYITSLAISLSGQPYVAFCDFNNSQKVTVMKFDGTNWINVGNVGFSVGMTVDPYLTFDPTGQPYVSFKDYGSSLKATVMKFEGTNWLT
jgi:hypothetical protein